MIKTQLIIQNSRFGDAILRFDMSSVIDRPIYKLRNDKNIISSVSVTDIVFNDYLGKLNYRDILKVKT